MNEKAPLLGANIPQRASRDGSRAYRGAVPLYRLITSISVATLVLLVIIWSDSPWWEVSRASKHGSNDDAEFDWTKVKPSASLKYVPCYKSFYCARLEVPLDWNSTDPKSTRATLAIVKRPAEVDVTHESYGGAVLFNPGGPGGSGIDLLSLYGEGLAAILNVDLDTADAAAYANQSRFYDLISWDPRGVGATRPLVEGYTDPFIRQEFDQRFIDLSGSLQHREIFNRVYDIKGIYGQLLSSSQDGIPDHEHPARFVGTSSVVRDMVEIIEKHGEWREHTVKRILKHRHRRGKRLSKAETALIKQRTAYKKNQEKLQYWGFSYGTIVGQTFASMYPERVGRLAIDGVVNATDYYAGDWKTELIDTEKITKNFTLECEAAGPDNCPFATLTKSSKESLLDVFERTISQIAEIPISGLNGKSPVYVTDFVITSLLFTAWYSGFVGYSLSADLMANAASRNLSFFDVRVPNLSCDKNPATFIDRSVAQSIILCSDADSKMNQTRDEYWEYTQFLYKQSKHYGYTLSRVTMPCHTFDMRPKWRFAGPFGAKTANPILILSQTLDPVTPLISAKGASTLFPGSQVVEAQGIGHCTLGYPSLCAMKQIKQYFYTGKVPKEYTRCPAAFKPFRSLEEIVNMTNDLSPGDRLMQAGALRIAQNFPPGNEALKYGKREKLPGVEAGSWWSTDRQPAASSKMQKLVDAQY